MTGPIPVRTAVAMPDPTAVQAGETGLLRLFALNMPPKQARFQQEPGAAAQALGVDALDSAHVDIFDVSDLEDLGLEGYLTQGAGIPADRIAADLARLRAQTGWVMAVRSRAFGGGATTLRPVAALDLIGVYAEPGTDWRAGRVERTRPGSDRRPSSRASPRQTRARARRLGAAVFAVVMLALAGFMWMVVT